MAFLDNSGDIILDAVLTDLGRKRLAEGNFRITQFAFGDDEVDYSLYDKNHPSGSAYYDLEILQTPVFESFTRTNANINYGLASFNGNPNLLYLPTLVLNQKQPGGSGRNAQAKSNIIYLSANETTTTNLVASGVTETKLQYSSTPYLLFETGLQSSSLGADSGNQTEYVINQGLVDPNLLVSADNRLFSSLSPMGTESKFEIGASTYENDVALAPETVPLSAGNTDLANYGTATIVAKLNTIYPTTISGLSDTAISAISGPRGVFSAFGLNPFVELTDSTTRSSKYELYGKVSQNLFSDGKLYDFIDTVVYVRGQTTGVTSQVVIRIIRSAS